LRENFDRFNFAIHKEKEMADFRRWILAFAALVLVLGSVVPASAQYGVVCSTSAGVAPTLRNEGFTELVGDIVLTCSKAQGAVSTPAGTTVGQANITVNIGANTSITSRTLPVPTGLSAPQGVTLTEALLLVDDPQPAVQNPCTNPFNPTVICAVTGNGFGSEFTAAPAAKNVFQGILGLGGPGANASTITFLGVPVDPPATGTLTYRITNIRVDATNIAQGIPVTALVTSSGSTSIGIVAGQDTAVVGYSTTGLKQDIPNYGPVVAGLVPSFLECESSPLTKIGVATFTENFATAFKVITSPGNAQPWVAPIGYPLSPQNVPGTVYNSEGGLQIQINGSSTIGVADHGTRLAVQILNVPPGAIIYADTWAQSPASYGCTDPGVSNAGCALVSDATLVTTTSTGTTPTPADPGMNAAILPALIDNSLGTAPTSGWIVWEVTNTNSSAIDTLAFNIYASFVGQPNNTLPNKPTTAYGGFYPTAGSATASELIPTFSSTLSQGQAPGTTLFTASQCVTYLLFPYITDAAGFDTGIAISNTSMDVLGTTPQNTGSCSVNFYSGGALALPVYTTAVIPGGGTDAFTLAGLDTNYPATPAVPFGYAIATCNFQYAHGYSFVSDYQLEHFAAAYLALVIPDATPRTAQPFLCSSGALTCTKETGEQLVH
jgi:hypothetical protein